MKPATIQRAIDEFTEEQRVIDSVTRKLTGNFAVGDRVRSLKYIGTITTIYQGADRVGVKLDEGQGVATGPWTYFIRELVHL